MDSCTPMILTPCPYDPIRPDMDSCTPMMLTPCPYGPIRPDMDSCTPMILTPCPYDPIRPDMDSCTPIILTPCPYGPIRPDMDSCTPANQWGTFDPRFRPWYSAAASGPKNVVMVIDVSGSMSNKYMVPSRYTAVTCDSCLQSSKVANTMPH